MDAYVSRAVESSVLASLESSDISSPDVFAFGISNFAACRPGACRIFQLLPPAAVTLLPGSP